MPRAIVSARVRAPDRLCPVVHVHENHDSGSGAQCLPLAGTEPFLRLTSNLLLFLSMCPADSLTRAALATLAPRSHLAFVCMCAGAFLSIDGASLRDFSDELEHDFGRDPCVRCVLRRMPCSGCASAAAQASGAVANAIFCVLCSAAVGLKLGMSGECMMHVANILTKWCVCPQVMLVFITVQCLKRWISSI